MKNLLILGAGGFGHMIQETAKILGYEEVVFLDDAVIGTDIIGKCCDYKAFLEKYDTAVAGLGDNGMRLYWTEQLMEAGYNVPAIIHPSAVVSPSAKIGEGSFIMQNAVVNTNTVIEHGVLVNSGAVVDHDSFVGCGAHIGLGSVVKANCTIESKRKVEEGEVVFSTRRKIDGVGKNRNLEDALYAFGFGTQCSYVKPFGEGHINETYAVYMPVDGEDELCYILQRVNNNVFKDPAGVMENIFRVTEYLRNVIREEGGDPDRETLAAIKTKNGCTYFEDNEGQPWRSYHFIHDSVCFQSVEKPEQFYQSGNSFGHFLKQLGNYPASELNETIPDFHNTVKRFEAFQMSLKRDIKNRAASCKKEIEFALNRKEDCGVLVKQQEEGTLPLRVTHNDTKLNNIMIDDETRKAICVIDLDTVMPGLAVNDFGDSIRFGASTGEEDERDLSKVSCSMELFDLYTKGFIEGCNGSLTKEELDMLPIGAMTMTYECGMRFLTDYLEGDHYFKVHREGHNLDRCRTQFKLVKDMEEKLEQMNEIVNKYR